MPDVSGIVPVLFALFGLVLGLVLRSVIAAASIRAANRKAAAILEEARQQQSTLVIGAKGEIARLRAEAELAQQADRAAAAAEAERLRLLEVTLNEREAFFAGREVAITERERALVDESVALDVARANVNTRLAEVAGLDPEAARNEVLSRFTEEAERESKRLQATLERRAQEDAADR
ncbi:MAG: Rnase Y domain-containing protein, partial [Candidatus Limnocylindrus sp.]